MLQGTGSRGQGLQELLPALELRLQSIGSVVVAHRLSCLWNPPGPGIEPVSVTLAGGFFTTEPPEKSPVLVIISVVGVC